MDKQKFQQNFGIVNLGIENLPTIAEDTKTRYQYVPFGVYGHDDFFYTLGLGYSTSTTTAAAIEGISDLIYGKGLYTHNAAFEETLDEILPQEEIKRVAFDFKLFGNAAFQVYWDDAHEKIVKMYHVPVQYLRAEKIGITPKIQNYYYCTDWMDERAKRNKKIIPAFGTSKQEFEILYIKNYTPGLYYYSLPDWVSAVQFAMVEAELSNLHVNNIENGFLPAVMINFNNGTPAPEERQTIEDLMRAKFTGTKNAGRFMLSFNDDPSTKPTIDVIQIDNLHEKYEYVANYAVDRILVAHRITSPLLFGIRTESNYGFGSQSDEMMTAFSILQTMTIAPFQNIILNALDVAFKKGGYDDVQLYFEQLTPLAILAEQAKDSGQTIEEVADDTNKQLENPATTDKSEDQTTTDINKPTPQPKEAGPGQETNIIRQSSPFFNEEYETTKY